jgi:DNA-directed RNA polymerase subunit K/omega
MKSLDYKKLKISNSAITRNVNNFDEETGNIYKTVSVLSKRANQISAELKEEFVEKSRDFHSASDSLEEFSENREQIEVARFFEQLPKPSILAIHEFEKGQIYYKDPE